MTTIDKTTDLLRTVEHIRPIIEEFAAQSETDRRVPEQTYSAMFDSGLFGMCAPKAYGGLEMHPVETMKVWEAVARIDSAAAWNLVMNQSVADFAAWLPEEGAREVFDNGPATVAGALFPPGSARRVEGGWRVSACVPFASGCQNATWLALPAFEMDGDQIKVDPETDQPVQMAVFLPREEATILDTWHTLGMRGTGSADIEVNDVFVPSHRVTAVGRLSEPAPGFEGPLFRFFPWLAILGESIVSVAVAASALDDLIELAATKTPAYGATALRELPLAQHAAGKALGRINAARDTLYRSAEEGFAEAADGSLLSDEAKVRLQTAVCFTAEICAEAVRIANGAAGTSAISLGHSFERYFRDIHVLTQHASKSNDRYASAGRLMFGLENDWVWLTF
jgi:indole-3-acetate monooxygenase